MSSGDDVALAFYVGLGDTREAFNMAADIAPIYGVDLGDIHPSTARRLGSSCEAHVESESHQQTHCEVLLDRRLLNTHPAARRRC